MPLSQCEHWKKDAWLSSIALTFRRTKKIIKRLAHATKTTSSGKRRSKLVKDVNQPRLNRPPFFFLAEIVSAIYPSLKPHGMTEI